MERKAFDGLAGKLLIDHANLAQEQVDKVLAIQKELAAKAANPRDVPLTGDIAVKEGFIKSEAKGSIMLAQAAERLTQSGEGKGQGVFLSADGKSFDLSDKSIKMFERPFIGGGKDSPALVQAQASEHLSALLDGGAKISGMEVSDKAREALKVIGGNAYMQAANEMQSSGLKPESASTAKGYAKDILSGTEMSRNQALVILHDEIREVAKGIPEEQKAKFNEVVSKRESQITLDLSANAISTELEKTQDGKGSNDSKALGGLQTQFGIASAAAPEGFLTTAASNKLVSDIKDVAQGGVTLGEVTKVRDALESAKDNFRTKGDEGTSLSAAELRVARAEINDGLNR